MAHEHDGRVTNSVVHTQTRDSENERQRIDQIALLDIALRFNPDIICVGEMRGPEANAAQEAARVGIAVLTTIHSNSSEGTYRRMVSLCKRYPHGICHRGVSHCGLLPPVGEQAAAHHQHL